MAEFVNTIDLLGDDAVTNALIDRSISEFNDNVIREVGDYAFHACTNLTSVILPQAHTIRSHGFENCTSLKNVDLTLISKVYLYDCAFKGCVELTNVNIPNLYHAGSSGVFENCTKLETVSFPHLDKLSGTTFTGCSSLSNVNLPAVKELWNSVFRNCTALKSISLPKVTKMYNPQQFANCALLESVYLPIVTNIEASAFLECTALKVLDLPLVATIGSDSFKNSGLSTLILRKDTVCTLSNTSAFTGTPFADGGTGGTLLVPRALVTEYPNATNWPVILGYSNNRVLALEDYTVDGTITGEIDWNKLNGGAV